MAFSNGFKFHEAKECLALAANVESKNTPSTSNDPAERNALPIIIESAKSDKNNWPLPVPDIDNWKIIINPKESIGLDNYWRLYQSKDNPQCYAVAIRGTIATAKSVLADLMVEMRNAEGSLHIQGNDYSDGCGLNIMSQAV